MTRSSSSSAGWLVSNKAGRTFAASPKSVIQISPLLMTGILVLHEIEHQSTFQGRLVAKANIFILFGQFQEFLAHRAPFNFTEFGQFIDNFGGAHMRSLAETKRFSSLKSVAFVHAASFLSVAACAQSRQAFGWVALECVVAHSIAANSSSSDTVAKLVAESDMA